VNGDYSDTSKGDPVPADLDNGVVLDSLQDVDGLVVQGDGPISFAGNGHFHIVHLLVVDESSGYSHLAGHRQRLGYRLESADQTISYQYSSVGFALRFPASSMNTEVP